MLTKQHIQWAIDNIDSLVNANHVTPQWLEQQHNEGFFYDVALDREGFFVIPNDIIENNVVSHHVDFDFGDTSSDGILLDNVRPDVNINQFKTALLAALKQILQTMKGNKHDAL